ncbi:MAG: hypothetical protein WBM50_25480 [Acidimicrobiales bacterium]
MSAELGAPVRLLSEEEKQRLDEVRRSARQRAEALINDGPDDPLGALAWLAGVLGRPTDGGTDEMRDRIDLARSANFTWRQIADALGEGDSPDAGRRIMDRRKSLR